MPPKPKYTRAQIVSAALNVVSKKGMQALTAKELGKALGTSTSPIFTVFQSMQEVQDAVKAAAMERFEAYARQTGSELPAFKQIGMQMIRFAKEEPRLYSLIFMSEDRSAQSFEDIYGRLGGLTEECLSAIRQDYGLSEKDARFLFEHVWIYTFGIGALCATGACRFSQAQIDEMLTQNFTAMMALLKSGKNGE